MDENRLSAALSPLMGVALAAEIVKQFIAIRRDVATRTLERAAPGKFVEVLVQAMQQMATGAFDPRPNVDDYLSRRIESETALPEGLRVCGARTARAMYTLRNKRNIAHMNEVDPNTFDLALAHQMAAWIMAELVRTASGLTMQEAGELIDLIQAPVGTLVEEIDGVRLVHADVSVRGEILILLFSQYPGTVPVTNIATSMKARSAGSIRNCLSEMRFEKLVFGDGRTGYRLTQAGYAAALAEIRSLAA